MSRECHCTNVQNYFNKVSLLGLTLAQQIAELDDTAPADVDIERLDGGLGEEDGNEDLAAGRGHYLDVGYVSYGDPSYYPLTLL